MEWISVNDRLPSEINQVEVVFFKNPYEWWTGLFTPKNFLSNASDYRFEFHAHWDDDRYHLIEGITHWMPLPQPPKGQP